MVVTPAPSFNDERKVLCSRSVKLTEVILLESTPLPLLRLVREVSAERPVKAEASITLSPAPPVICATSIPLRLSVSVIAPVLKVSWVLLKVMVFALRVSISRSSSSPPSITSSPIPALRMSKPLSPYSSSSPEPPVRVSSPLPPNSTALPLKALASMILPLRPPTNSAISMLSRVLIPSLPATVVTTSAPPVRLDCAVISAASNPALLTVKVIIHGPKVSVRTAPSRIEPSPLPSRPRSAAAVESLRAAMTRSLPSSWLSLILIAVPASFITAVKRELALSRVRISSKVVAEPRSTSTTVTPSLRAILKSAVPTASTVTPAPSFRLAIRVVVATATRSRLTEISCPVKPSSCASVCSKVCASAS